MSRSTAPRTLSLTEELEKLEQSITLTLQEIDSNFSQAHRIVTASILPIVEQYAKHSSDVWHGSKFWKHFFEASANVSLSGYEEPAIEDDTTTSTAHTDSTSTALDTPTDHDEYHGQQHAGANNQHDDDDDDEEFTVDSPTQVTGLQTTPKINSTKKTTTKAPPAFRSPSPRKYTGKNPQARQPDHDPSTPRAHTTAAAAAIQSSPFEPHSAAYLPSTQKPPRTVHDPLMHRILDKNYRIQATPHTQRRQPHQHQQQPSERTPAPTKQNPWDDSPQSSPAMPAPQLRSDLFSPPKQPRTPGISILTPARGGPRAPTGPTTSTGRTLFSPQDKTYTSTQASARRTAAGTQYFSPSTPDAANRTAYTDDRDDDDDDDDDTGDTYGASPPKTLQFHVPQSRLLQTPAREASRRIVEELLLTAGVGEGTSEIEGIDGDDVHVHVGGEVGAGEESPSVVRRGWGEDDTF